jgi:hypothetical protein
MKLLALLLILVLAQIASATTYYIDYVNGSNANNGLAKTLGGGNGPWKTHPYMQNVAGCATPLPNYTHVAGDQFIFKGGVAWPPACFGMKLLAGGSSVGVQDYYGVDLTWFAGASFARPLWDMQQQVPTSPGVFGAITQFNMVWGNQQPYVTFDNFEVANMAISNNQPYSDDSDAAFDFRGTNQGTQTVKNLYIHDAMTNSHITSSWVPGYGAGGVAFVGTVDTVTIDFTNSFGFNTNGVKVFVGLGGAALNTLEVKNSKFINTMAGCFSAFNSCHDSEFTGITQVVWDDATKFPGGLGALRPHTQVIEGEACSFGERDHIYNNWIHDNPSAGVTIYVDQKSFIYNNVLTNNSNGNILLTGTGCNGNASDVGYVLNNTVDCSNGIACFQTDAKGTLLGTTTLNNNIFITNGNPLSIQSTIATFNNGPNNRTMPTTEANTYGFIKSNKYFPTNINDLNVNGAGVNYTSSCTGNLSQLCKDAQGAPWFGAAYATRSASVAWDLGAYCLSNCTGAAPPAWACSPASINWPNQPVGFSFNAPISTTCTNNGSGTLTMTSIALSGGNPGDFSFTTNPSGGNCGTTLSSGASCTVTVTFIPTTLGARSTTLVFTDNAASSPQNISVTGTASYFVQTCTNYTAGPHTSVPCTFASNQIGKVNYCTVYLYDTADTLTTVTDTASNTYTAVSAQTTQTSNGIQRSYLATSIANSSAPTITANFGSSSTHHGGLNCAEYVVVSSLDQTVTATGNSNSPSSGNITTANSNEQLVTTILSPNLAATPTAGWTQRTSSNDFYADQIQNAGTYSGTASFSSADFWITQLTAIKSQPLTVATPTFSPVAGTYTSTQNVTISTTTGGATICYTTDGSTPTANGAGTCTHGTTYSGTVSVAVNETLNAIGSESGFTDSAVGSAVYVIAPIIATPTFSPVAGSYGSPQTVTLSSGTGGVTFCSTIDGSSPTTNGAGTCTHGASGSTVTVNASLTIKVIATESGFTDSALASAAYTITAAQVAAVVFTPGAPAANAAYHFPATITLSTVTSAATLCYTLDGSTPTANGAGTCTHGTTLANNGTVFLTYTQILSAIGTESGFTDSGVTTAIIVISGVNTSPRPTVIYLL